MMLSLECYFVPVNSGVLHSSAQSAFSYIRCGHVSFIEEIISGLEAANAGQVSDMGFSVKTQLREGEGQRLCVDCRLIASDGG